MIRSLVVCAGVVLLAGVAGCSSAPAKKPVPFPARPSGVLRLGYTPAVADAPALAGLQLGYLSADLGQVVLRAVPFGTTAAEAQALRRGQLDAAYIDPVAAVAVWQGTGGGVRIVAGAASGGAQLVVRGGITSARQLAGAVVAAPAGTAQEAALAWWLKQNGVAGHEPRDVTMSEGYLAGALRSGKVAGAWEPAPADAQLAAAGGHVLVDEASLWPQGRFATAVLVVTGRFLAAHGAAAGLLLRGHVQAVRMLTVDRPAAVAAVGRALAVTAGPVLLPALLARSFGEVQFTVDPLAVSVAAEARRAAEAGLLRPPGSLAGLFDLGPLNALLKTSGMAQVRG